MEKLFLLHFLLFQFVMSDSFFEMPATCESEIYCQGELLHEVQMSRIFNDSKTFVDKSLRFDPKKVLETFDGLKLKYKSGKIPKEILEEFLDANFMTTDLLEPWIPSDWTPNPSISKKIADPKFRKWALDLNEIWKTLGRRIKESMTQNPDRHSMLYVPNGFIVPGGRFNELYYWDTLWIVKGLLICDMFKTAKGMIENLLFLVDSIGHMPNGNRIYYTQRTQPPMLTLMVESYYKSTGDFNFIKDNIHILDKEMDYWNSARMIEVNFKGRSYSLYRYHAVSSGPRPESYREDMEKVPTGMKPEDINNFFIEVKSGAESGWDFSSRWFKTEEFIGSNLTYIRTSTIIPVDLNAILQRCFSKLSEWYNVIGNDVKYKLYRDLANQLRVAIHKVLWDENDGIWYDYDLKTNRRRRYFYLSNFVPLWTESYKFSKYYLSTKIINYIEQNALTLFIGGTPTSLEFSLEQWDFPNAWPPLQAFLIQGLENIRTTETSITAFQFASFWLKSNYRGFKTYHKMFEKYNSLAVGESGSGGEYEAQNGFGWTNGIVLEFLNKWGAEVTSGPFI